MPLRETWFGVIDVVVLSLPYISPNNFPFHPKAGTVSRNATCAAPTHVHVVASWFNPCAFAHAAPGELGNASRTPVSGPGFVNTDFSVIKQFALPWENMGLNFRVTMPLRKPKSSTLTHHP